MSRRYPPARSCDGWSCVALARTVGVVRAIGAVGLAVWSSQNPSGLESIVGAQFEHEAAHGSSTILPGVPRGSTRRKFPVLFIQMDDRPISSTLDNSTTFTALSVAINYHYALRHGYDYRFATVINDEAHKANVSFLSPTSMFKSIEDLWARGVNLAGCFHPILGTQRAAPWCKVLVAWLAAHETVYDYVVFLDADA